MMDRQLDMFQRAPVAAPVAGLRYVADIIALADEARLLAQVDARPWLDDLKRRVQHYGYKYDYRARAISRSMFVGPLPPFAIELAARLIEAKLLAEMPDQLIVNEYLPGQGITPHVDCEPCFKEHVVTVSLGSHCEMEFVPKDEEQDSKTIMLEPRSALLISGEARYDWRHTIRARLSDRGRMRTRRVSLTFRNVILAVTEKKSVDAIMAANVTTPRAEYGRWLAAFIDESEHLLRRELQSPRDAFVMARVTLVPNQFYRAIDHWKDMVTRLLTGLRRLLRHPEDWMDETRRALDISRLLRFSVRDINHVEQFDLNNRETYSDASGLYSIRRAFERGRAEPDWAMAVQTMAAQVRTQLTALNQIDEADLLDPSSKGTEVVGNNVTVNINSSLHQSPINILGRQRVQFEQPTPGASRTFEALRSEMGEVRAAILTNQDLVVGIHRTLAASQWDEVMPTLQLILDRVETLAGEREPAPEEIRALAIRAVNELELERAFERSALQQPILQNLAAAGIWSLLGYIFSGIVG